MASAFVPPPPDNGTLDHILSSQTEANWNSQSLLKVSRSMSSRNVPFGGEGFYEQLHQQDALSNYEHSSQTVPIASLGTKNQRTTYPIPNDLSLEYSFNDPEAAKGERTIVLHSVMEIPERYRGVFSAFTHFNFVQSVVFNDVLYSDAPLVASAPTGSGKTVLFELAIVRLLIQMADNISRIKIVYVAPIKALCAERHEDWTAKFGPLGLKCSELTGDSQLDDYFELQNAHIIMTTPEKWDSMTRKWRDNKSLVQMVQLFMIDEIHQLNDKTRGPTMEAIVCRMKTVRASVAWERSSNVDHTSRNPLLRFIAVSATVPNVDDVAIWLGSEEHPAVIHCIDESHRPVQLRRVVLSYPDSTTDFKFDLSLNYKLSGIIQCYSDYKPTLVFCATRKGTQQAAAVLVKDSRFIMNVEHKRKLQIVSSALNDSKLRELVSFGVGYHHAGMSSNDRRSMETMFYEGELPVLFATSTLAMGVNLPAHLVVIKSTMHYANGMFEEYSESQLLQMIGRAGRPQFDTSATAVIMTRNSTRNRYEALLGGTQLVESNLHSHLIEHLNAEIVLQTITDVSIALDWLKSTFLYTRIKKNPKHYGIPEHLPTEELQEKLQEMCLENLKQLEAIGLLTMDDGFTLIPTDTGKLMARFYVAFESMKRFLKLKNADTLAELVEELSKCKEFQDVHLRVNEKRVLNQLNKDKHRQTIRFPMSGKIKSTDMKVNCLIQATLGCLSIQEFSLNQDSQKIFRSASRMSKCLMEIQMLDSNFRTLLNSIALHKCISAKLWENSKHVAKQLDKIGVTLSTTLVNARLTSFDKILETNARELELIVNRHPPFGNQVKEAVSKMPKYSIAIEQSSALGTDQAEIVIILSLVNHQLLNESGSTAGPRHGCMLIVGDNDNAIVLKQKINDSQILSTGKWSRKITVTRAKKGCELVVHLVSLNYVGIDVQETFTPRYSVYVKQSPKVKEPLLSSTSDQDKNSQMNVSVKKQNLCNHRCSNKAVCGHECCKYGLPNMVSKMNGDGPSYFSTPSLSKHSTKKPIKAKKSGTMAGHLDELHQKVQSMPVTPSLRRLKVNASNSDYCKYTSPKNAIEQYCYKPKQKMVNTHQSISSLSSLSAVNQDYSCPISSNEEFSGCFEEVGSVFTNLNMELMKLPDDEWSHFDYADLFEDNGLGDDDDELSRTPSPLPPPLYHCQPEDSYMSEEIDHTLDNLYDNSSLIGNPTHSNTTRKKLSYGTLDDYDFNCFASSPKRQRIQGGETTGSEWNARRIVNQPLQRTDSLAGFKRVQSMPQEHHHSDVYTNISTYGHSATNKDELSHPWNSSSQLFTAHSLHSSIAPQAKAAGLYQPTVHTSVQSLQPTTNNRLALTDTNFTRCQPPVSSNESFNTPASTSILNKRALTSNTHLFSSEKSIEKEDEDDIFGTVFAGIF